jgi:hypothetical protein
MEKERRIRNSGKEKELMKTDFGGRKREGNERKTKVC